jgi:hypothetical protein
MHGTPVQTDVEIRVRKPKRSSSPGRILVAATSVASLMNPDCRFTSHASGMHSQGLRISTQSGSKSRTLRVTTVMPWTRAVAAIKASRMGLGSGKCSLAQRCATTASTGSIRPLNSGNTLVSSHTQRMAPWRLSLRSSKRMPSSSSWIVEE